LAWHTEYTDRAESCADLRGRSAPSIDEQYPDFAVLMPGYGTFM
jgi:hypothetical protein